MTIRSAETDVTRIFERRAVFIVVGARPNAGGLSRLVESVASSADEEPTFVSPIWEYVNHEE